MLTQGELLKKCRKDLNKDMQRTRDLIEQNKKDLTKTLVKGKNYLSQLGGEMVRPALYFKANVDLHHDTLTQYLGMIDYMTEHYHDPVPEIECVSPHVELGYFDEVSRMKENVANVWIPMGHGSAMFHVPFETIFDRRNSIIRRVGLLKFADVSQPQVSRMFVVKLGVLHRLTTYFRSVRSIKAVNFLRNLQGKKTIINGAAGAPLTADMIYASKIAPKRKKQKKPDYDVAFKHAGATSTVTIRRSWIYFTDDKGQNLWAALPGKKDFKHVASLSEAIPGLSREK